MPSYSEERYTGHAFDGAVFINEMVKVSDGPRVVHLYMTYADLSTMASSDCSDYAPRFRGSGTAYCKPRL